METASGAQGSPSPRRCVSTSWGGPPGNWSSTWGPSPARGPAAASGRGGVPCEHPVAPLCSPLPHRSGRKRPDSRVAGAVAARQLLGTELESHKPHRRQGVTGSTRRRGQASGWAQNEPRETHAGGPRPRAPCVSAQPPTQKATCQSLHIRAPWKRRGTRTGGGGRACGGRAGSSGNPRGALMRPVGHEPRRV